MPFYEYQCRHCGHHVEALQKVSDPPLKKCPDCGRAQLARLVSRVAFRLKGGGWYETDFKADGENKRNLVGNEPTGADADKPADPTAKADTVAKPDTAGKPDKAAKAAPATTGKARAKAPARTKARPKAAAKKKATGRRR